MERIDKVVSRKNREDLFIEDYEAGRRNLRQYSLRVRQGIRSARTRWKSVCTGLRLVSARLGYCSRPRFLIIGAQKAGTVALSTYLPLSPHIVPAGKKEIYFFNPGTLEYLREHGVISAVEQKLEFSNPKIYKQALAWYHSHFPLPYELGRYGITFEATPGYLYHPDSPGQIFFYDPQMKLIVLLRDPVARAFSAWNMLRNFGKNPDGLFYQLADFREFDKAVKDEIDRMVAGDSAPEPSYVRRGLYYEQLARYFKYFERDQLLIIDSRTLKDNPALVLERIIRFLGLPPFDWHRVQLPPLHIGKYEGQMSEETRVLLRGFYEPHNAKLYELLGRDFGWQ